MSHVELAFSSNLILDNCPACFNGLEFGVVGRRAYDLVPLLSSKFVKRVGWRPGSFSFREWDCTMALKGVKSLVPRGALLARHAPHEPNPFLQVNTHDNTASAAHRGVRRDSGLSPLSWETPSLARHALLGLLCDVVWVSDLE